MIRLWPSPLILIALSGCTSPDLQVSKPSSVNSSNHRSEHVISSSKGTNTVTLRPLDGANGRLVTVNRRLNFVVIDYSLNAIPPLETRLVVVREGQKVGVLRLTGPIRGSSAAAEIISGEAEPGDAVFPEESF